LAYRFLLRDRTVQSGVRRIAGEQFDRLFSELDDPGLSVDVRVHQVRKRCKKVRGLIRLVRPVFDGYRRENAALRDAARELSELRDSGAMLAILETRLLDRSEDLDAQAVKGLRALLTRQRPDETEAMADAALEAFTRQIRSVRSRARRWQVAGDGFDAFDEGLARTHQRMDAAMQNALKAPGPANLHEWRKRAKYHWYHARLLHDIWPEGLGGHVGAADQLGQMLGDVRDLSLLVHEFESYRTPETARLIDPAIAVAERQKAAARPAMVRLGRYLTAETGEALASRWRAYWDIWRTPEKTLARALEI